MGPKVDKACVTISMGHKYRAGAESHQVVGLRPLHV